MAGRWQKLQASVVTGRRAPAGIKAKIGEAQPAFTSAGTRAGAVRLAGVRRKDDVHRPADQAEGRDAALPAGVGDVGRIALLHGGRQPGSADRRPPARRHAVGAGSRGRRWQKHVAGIKAVGFEKVDKDQDYASLHLNVGADAMLANKTFGAILLGLGVEIETPLPNLAKIKQ